MFQVQAAEIKVSSVSFHSKDLAYNLPKMAELAEVASKNGARLIVFPEMSSTGFLYDSFANANWPWGVTTPGEHQAILDFQYLTHPLAELLC